MILLFPDLDTVRLALTSGIVPTDVTLAPAAVSFDDQGKIYIESTANLTRTVTKNLDRIGVKGSKRHAVDNPQEITCWPQLLPVTRDPIAPTISNQAPVLFELEKADDLPVLVTEMLRLGNDRQGFRWFATDERKPSERRRLIDPTTTEHDHISEEAGSTKVIAESKRVLLRVIGPPYYTLLRAIDKGASGTSGTVRAYLERAPRVWVEVGHTLPLAQQLRVSDKQLLLIREPREWTYLDEAPFQDVYDIMQFKLPAAPVAWTETKAPKKMSVPLRLAGGNASDTAELWVLRENAIEQLDTLVRDSDDRLLQRLMFAVATDAQGARTVVLRVRPSKLTPPVLALDNALAFKPFWKLPNLFLPVGKRLHPTLRRDAVRKLLADDADQVVWLYPDDKGGFTPEFVPDAAFRSLEDWVDYVIEAEQQALAAWIEATRFDFDHFVCKDVGGPKNKPDKGDKDSKEKDDDVKAPKGVGTAPKASMKGKPGTGKPTTTAEFLPPAEEVKKPNEWKIKATELETQFLALEGALDAPERQAIWPELAAAYSGAKEPMDAAICWLDALWDSDPLPPAWLAGWVRSELPGAGATIKADEFDKLLNHTGTGLAESRAVVSAFLWLAAQQPVPSWLPARLPAVQNYLETHDSSLPVRAVWLAGFRLAQLSGADVLGLARVRDRLLKRLLEQGLQAERDLPYFLRVAGVKDSERMRVVRDKSMELHTTIRKWIDDSAAVQKNEHLKANHPLVDLLFAFAVAKLGETTQAKKLLDDARKAMEGPVPTGTGSQSEQAVTAAVVRNFLFKAFRYRIEQVLAGKPHSGQMSPEVLDELEDITKKQGTGPVNNPYKLAKYVVDRMREQSRIMEPNEKPDPYADWTKHSDEVKKALAELHTIRDPNKLAERIRKLYKDGVPGKPLKEVQFHVLHEGLPLAARVSESFTVELLALVPAALQGSGGANEPPDMPKKQGELLERAMFQAGHFAREDIVKKLVDDFTALVHTKSQDMRFKLINVVAGQCMRSLKKLGLSNEIDRFLTKLHSEVLGGASTEDLRKKHQAKPETWGAVLQTLLNLAGGWLHFGRKDRADPILDAARNELLNSNAVTLPPKDYTELARAYVTALGQGQAESALARMIELFKRMSPAKITNTWTTAQYYSRFHLNLVEDVIRAVVNDDAALGPSGRRWLDDDEYLVRRRIHADMKRNLLKSNL
ncbi:hypothetical protein VT84_10790 [Gemmata sp. SH-PL17]|uniref:hypothetical protein n=1 Tax=Gemmata sp. SH-PL17 TaxID=1630693 RepID=UPI00078DAC37|nr:hypothetical protein [Gemmata sp. SH-PL17]AMV24875.1 hypothetical protein VT84_10790 [Gemmata sp. SH-PL17]